MAKQRISITIDDFEITWLKAKAKKRKEPLSTIITNLIWKAMQEEKKNRTQKQIRD